jgi:hypothetical protein
MVVIDQQIWIQDVDVAELFKFQVGHFLNLIHSYQSTG